jgi:polyphosphate kinase
MPKRRKHAAPPNGAAATAKKKKTEAASAKPSNAPADLIDPSLYINRELSLLAFQRRVLEEAQDGQNPILERVKFLAIVGSNLDEFFMVRVAGLIAQMDAGIVDTGADGMSPRAQLVAIRRDVKRLMADIHNCLAAELYPALEEA